ncbi:Putative general secretion pathway protein K [Phaeobacter sp. CECT 5382]|uniref:type II secretion system minor pseudopilin GspK n=1 Tax=Phaeobacter sp. CECT 5382 TaxID=1712645 RepID=UPI0006D95FD6|nr:type II secretion system minor pseudopilin GspK [Phaeobacter sp. CECT 5382]CUH89343.1 Putative general secretion pathway protein K [Phaeobacter sp. CECT 5382]
MSLLPLPPLSHNSSDKTGSAQIGSAQAGSTSAGFVLVNALVLVAALAAVATLLLMRSEQGRARLQTGLVADQLTLGLDAFDALALTRLARDTSGSDHSNEVWARPQAPLPLARGEVNGQISDLQGRFNVNWLSDPDNLLAQKALHSLLAKLGLAPQIAQNIQSFVTPGGLSPAQRARWQRQAPPLDPVGGPLFSADQLAELPGLTPRAYARLRPLITALPADSRLNVNTAPPQVLAAFLPHLPAASLIRLTQRRDRSPFVSVEAFLTAARLDQPPQQAQESPQTEGAKPTHNQLQPDQISVSSAWFLVESSSQLETAFAHRITLLHRPRPGRRPALIWQVTTRP